MQMLSPLVALPFLVHLASALHADPPKPKKGSSGPEWVEKTIAAAADWESRVAACATKAEKRLIALPDEAPAGAVKPTPLKGPLNEFADLSPEEMAWVEEQYKAEETPSFAYMPLNMSEPPVPPALEGGDAQQDQELPFTTGECKPAHGGKALGKPELHTCRFQNLYAINGVLEAHVLESDPFPTGLETIYIVPGVTTHSLKMMVHFNKYKSKAAFDAHMRGNFTRLDGTTVAFEPKWHFNIGHALYDGLYPAFVSLIQWGLDEAPFRVLKLGGHNPPNVEKQVPGAFARNEEAWGLIGGKGLVQQYTLREDAQYQHTLFETLVIGTGRNGNKVDMNANFSLGGGRDLGGPRRFRAHTFKSLDIPEQPAAIDKAQPVEGIIIDNRRWEDKSWVLPVRQEAMKHDVNLQFIEWGKDPDAIFANGGSKHNPAPSSGQFRSQLLMISKTRIHISSPGTAMMYQHFLPDGAVHINMGEKPGFPRLFMEEYMAEGAPYFRALYYWPYQKVLTWSYQPDRVMKLVLEAKELVQEGFEIPVPINTNLSPIMRVVKAYDYLTQSEEGLSSMTPLYLLPAKDPQYATDYATHFPHEFVRRPTPAQSLRPFNPCLLAELTKDYGEPCDGCIWAFP